MAIEKAQVFPLKNTDVISPTCMTIKEGNGFGYRLEEQEITSDQSYNCGALFQLLSFYVLVSKKVGKEKVGYMENLP